MPLNAVVRSLRARPSESADLSFEIPGILRAQNWNPRNRSGTAHLGRRVSRYDLTTELYPRLGEVQAASPEQLVFDAGRIRQQLTSGASAPFLFSLSNEGLASSLDQIIARRASAWLERFQHRQVLQARAQETFPEILSSLESMIRVNEERFNLLDAAYSSEPATTRESRSLSRTLPGYKVLTKTSTKSRPVAMWNSAVSGDATSAESVDTEVFAQGNTSPVQVHKMKQSASVPRVLEGSEWKIPGDSFDSQSVDSEMTSEGEQETVTIAPEIRAPRMDNELNYHQLASRLRDDLMRQEAASHRAPFLASILENELQAMDLEVRGIQLGYAHTFLISPIDGVVTAVYKEIGESVEPGEPVLRVENDEVIYAVGQIGCRGLLSLGQPVTLEVDDLYESGRDLTLQGEIVSIRGHEADNDEWDVIIECQNPSVAGAGRAVPINYQFDPDNTTLKIG